MLVVFDLALQGGTRITVTQMAQAITCALREREFRAGRFRVAYQSCDDSIARAGLHDEAKCAANARAYGADPDVIGVIGTLNSDCARAALPVLNRAAGGGLAMVSPLNSFVGLTRRGYRATICPPRSTRPGAGTTRVYPADDLHPAGAARRRRPQVVLMNLEGVGRRPGQGDGRELVRASPQAGGGGVV